MKKSNVVLARILTISCSVLLVLLVCYAEGPTGSLKGSVVDFDSKQPIPSVNVLLEGTRRGITTDENGAFEILDIPAGIYTVSFSSLGYEKAARTDVIVRSAQTSRVDAELHENTIQSEEVVVQASYFQNDDITPVSAVSFNAEEVRRAPGSAGDVSRILLALPSVAQVSDNANDLMVRGGSPTENGFYVDGFPIPTINHFPTPGSTGGPIGIINVGYLDDVSFLTGGFPASYGNRLSSVIELKLREGNREKVESQLDMNMGGFGGGVEGPMPGKKGSWFVSGRRSYLDLIVNSIGTGVAPRYGDVHAKAAYDLNQNHKLNLLDIFGTSTISIDRDRALASNNPMFGNSSTDQNSAGLSWRWLWGAKAFSFTSLTYSYVRSGGEWYDAADSKEALNRELAEHYVTARNINYLHPTQELKVEFGGEYEFQRDIYTYQFSPALNRIGVMVPALDVRSTFDHVQANAFFSAGWSPVSALTLTFGLRGDFSSMNDRVIVSPRAAVTYRINERWTANAAAGIFRQQLPMILVSQAESNKSLNEPSAVHYVIGTEYMLDPATKLTVEAYDKEYGDLPMSTDDPSLSLIDEGRTGNQFRGYSPLVDDGKAYGRGLEMLLQKKLAEDFYGIVSGSVSRCRYRDLNGVWRDRLYDNRYLASVIGGYRPNYEWEFSVRWNYAGGVPYTPYDLSASRAVNSGIIDQSRINQSRYPDYHCLNLRVDRRFFFQQSSIVVYINVMNVYNRKNVAMYYWDKSKNETETYYQWGFLPVMGFEYHL